MNYCTLELVHPTHPVAVQLVHGLSTSSRSLIMASLHNLTHGPGRRCQPQLTRGVHFLITVRLPYSSVHRLR